MGKRQTLTSCVGGGVLGDHVMGWKGGRIGELKQEVVQPSLIFARGNTR